MIHNLGEYQLVGGKLDINNLPETTNEDHAAQIIMFFLTSLIFSMGRNFSIFNFIIHLSFLFLYICAGFEV